MVPLKLSRSLAHFNNCLLIEYRIYFCAVSVITAAWLRLVLTA